jgi:hypothetical protein
LVNDGINETYDIRATSDGYYDTQYIYDKTGYWPGELYRLGVVYILKDGSLSPVFNIRGATNITEKSSEPVYKVEADFNVENNTLKDVLHNIEYSEEDYMIIGGRANNENAKGVIQLSSELSASDEPFPVLGMNITANKSVINELKKYVKGFFFVRQKRIPLTLAQGIVVGLDNESRTPTIPTLGGVLTNVNVENSFVETSDINDINFISEGFLSRYFFSLKQKKTGVWKKILIATAVVAVLAAAAVATVFTCGAAGVAIGAGLAAATVSGALAGGGALVAGAIGTIGIVAGSAIGVAAVAAGVEAGVAKARQNRNRRAAQAVKGRNEEIPKGYEREEKSDSRKLIQDISERYIIKDGTKNSPDAIIVPDYQVNQPYYNQFLTGDSFSVKLSYEQPNTNYLNDGYFESDLRHFYTNGYIIQNDNRSYDVQLVGVPDGCPIKMIGDNKYCARAGYAEEAYKYEF